MYPRSMPFTLLVSLVLAGCAEGLAARTDDDAAGAAGSDGTAGAATAGSSGAGAATTGGASGSPAGQGGAGGKAGAGGGGKAGTTSAGSSGAGAAGMTSGGGAGAAGAPAGAGGITSAGTGGKASPGGAGSGGAGAGPGGAGSGGAGAGGAGSGGAGSGGAGSGGAGSGGAGAGGAGAGGAGAGGAGAGGAGAGGAGAGGAGAGGAGAGGSDPCGVALAYDFEAGAQGFTHAPTSGLPVDDPWAIGTPTTLACHGGTKCWATNLTNSGYDDCQTAELKSPTIDLTSCSASPKVVTLSFWHRYVFEPKSSGTWFDGGLVQVSSDDGQSWQDVTPSQAYQGKIEGAYTGCNPKPDVDGHQGWSGTIPGNAWTEVKVDVPVAYRVATFRFRWLFGSDAATTTRGWGIDDVAITAQ